MRQMLFLMMTPLKKSGVFFVKMANRGVLRHEPTNRVLIMAGEGTTTGGFMPVYQTEPMIHTDRPFIHLLDINGIAHRAFYATRSNFEDTESAEFGRSFFSIFLASLYDLRLRMRGANKAVSVWDNILDNTARRRSIFPAYKVNRTWREADAFLESDMVAPVLRNIVSAYGILSVESDLGSESDDLIAGMAHFYAASGYNVFVHTRDKDMRQLAAIPYVNVCNTGKIQDLFFINLENFVAVHGFAPDLLPAFLALKGDEADNVPGVRGVGEKRAIEILSKVPAGKRTPEDIVEAADGCVGNASYIQNIHDALDDGTLETCIKVCTLSEQPLYADFFKGMDNDLKAGDWKRLDEICRYVGADAFRQQKIGPVLARLESRADLTGQQPSL